MAVVIFWSHDSGLVFWHGFPLTAINEQDDYTLN